MDDEVLESGLSPTQELLSRVKEIIKKRRQRGTKKRQKSGSHVFEQQEEIGVPGVDMSTRDDDVDTNCPIIAANL